jgi:gentisate 1,2-dioxygenase
MRAEFHRPRAGTATAARREVGSAVWQAFDGAGSVMLNGAEHRVGCGDMFVVPSWTAVRLTADAGADLDLFRFSDTPIFESLHQDRVSIDSIHERAPSHDGR